ncbi:MAG: Tat pathway signal protein [Phenylobacterium sp.]
MDRRRLIALAGVATLAPLGVARAEEKKKKSGGESYLPLDTLTATTIKSNGHRGVLTVDCGLDVPDARLREYANLSLPRLRAAYVQVMQTYAAGLASGAPPNPDFIARELQRQTDFILGRPGARLLLGAVVAN